MFDDNDIKDTADQLRRERMAMIEERILDHARRSVEFYIDEIENVACGWHYNLVGQVVRILIARGVLERTGRSRGSIAKTAKGRRIGELRLVGAGGSLTLRESLEVLCREANAASGYIAVEAVEALLRKTKHPANTGADSHACRV